MRLPISPPARETRQSKGGAAASPSAPDPEPGRVQRRQEQHGEHRGEDQAAHDAHRHRPEKDVARQRDHRQHRRRGGQHDGTETSYRRADDGLPLALAGGQVLVDLVDLDHRIAHDHAQHGDHAEKSHEAGFFYMGGGVQPLASSSETMRTSA